MNTSAARKLAEKLIKGYPWTGLENTGANLAIELADEVDRLRTELAAAEKRAVKIIHRVDPPYQLWED